jgi:hypothetical protein
LTAFHFRIGWLPSEGSDLRDGFFWQKPVEAAFARERFGTRRNLSGQDEGDF